MASGDTAEAFVGGGELMTGRSVEALALPAAVRLEPGHHYVWGVQGFRDFGCDGPPEELLLVAQESARGVLRDGTCAD